MSATQPKKGESLMTLQDAYNILHPATSADTLRMIRAAGGETEEAKKLEQACLIACQCIQMIMYGSDDGK